MEFSELRLLEIHNFGIVNPLRVRLEIWNRFPAMKLSPTPVKAQVHLLPLLLDLRGGSLAERALFLEEMENFYRVNDTPVFSALIHAPVTLKVLASHLQSRLIARRSDGTRHLMRFFDPEVFVHLLDIFPELEIDALLGPVKRWSWQDSRGGWRSRLSTNHREASAPFAPNESQWQRIDQIGRINRCLSHLRRRWSPAIENEPVKAVAALLDSAALAGLSDEADLNLYVKQALTWHESIHRHPAMMKRCAQVRTDGTSYVEACSDIDEKLKLILVKQAAEPIANANL